MFGMILWKAPGQGAAVTMVEKHVLHARFFCAQIARGPRTPELVVRRRVAQAVRRLKKAGAVRVVLPEGFAWEALLQRGGIRPMTALPLARRMAAELAEAELRRLGTDPAGARLAVAGERLSGELTRTVTELALRHRYVLLDVPYGGEELGRQLRREYGVTLLLCPGAEQMAAADVLVLFGPRPDLQRKNPSVLELYEGGELRLPPLLLPPALESKLPEGVDRPQMLCALQEAGALRPGQVTVGGE